jgi:hypothetical protein
MGTVGAATVSCHAWGKTVLSILYLMVGRCSFGWARRLVFRASVRSDWGPKLFIQGFGWAAFASAEAPVRSFRFFGPAQRVWRAWFIASRARSANSAAAGFSL